MIDKNKYADGFCDTNGDWHDPEDEDYAQAVAEHEADYGDYLYDCAKDDGTLRKP